MRQGVVRLASSRVAVAYPPSLACWFDDLIERRDEGHGMNKWVRLLARGDTGRFDLATHDAPPAEDLDLGDALAWFWERAAFYLIDDLSGAIALHAAGLRRDGNLVLLPGQTGTGKTLLSLWYRTQGFELATEEVVAAWQGTNGGGDTILCGGLPRPAILKVGTKADGMLRKGETPLAQQPFSGGLLLRLAESAAWVGSAIDSGLIVFPRFQQGLPLQLTVLTPAEASLRLIESCLNARNLPRGGLGLTSLLARRLPAVELHYGDTEQLTGTLDVLTRQVLERRPSQEDLAALCSAFSARAALHPASGAKGAKRAHIAATPARFKRRLTIGMATYDDYDGAYFTIQSLRMNNPELEGELEFVVVDNNPGGRCSEALSDLGKWIDGYRYVPRGEWVGTAMRNAVFEEASSPFVLCIDSHILIVPGALSKLIAYFESNPDSRDLLQGPMLYDDLRKYSTHMEPRWRDGMYGTWASDPRGEDTLGPAFEVPMHGLGLFACRADAWAGFNRKFRGFGGEEGYIHEKTRRRGGRALCLPFLRWMHRFRRPLGPPYVNRWDDRMRNYMIGWTELGLNTAEIEAHFGELLGVERSAKTFAEIKRGLRLG